MTADPPPDRPPPGSLYEEPDAELVADADEHAGTLDFFLRGGVLVVRNTRTGVERSVAAGEPLPT